MKLCKDCLQEIKAEQKKCTHVNCGTFQDFRRWVSVFPLLIALLSTIVALVALLTPLVNKLKTNKADVSVSVSAGAGESISVAATNKGSLGGSVQVGPLECEGSNDPVSVSNPFNGSNILLLC